MMKKMEAEIKVRIVLDVAQSTKKMAKKAAKRKHYGNVTAYLSDLIKNDSDGNDGSRN